MTRCASCAFDAPDDARLCPQCGRQLTMGHRVEERRTVTTLICDLVGFTALSERHDPETVDALLRRYYAVARRAVESYGGTVEKFIGDAVVAVFGVPSLHEDDPERGVRAGLRLVDEIDAVPAVAGETLEVRVGVNTGEVLVRLDVDPASGEGFLTGDAVNVAARLQAAAPPMAVAVGEATHAATERVFTFEACRPVALKGKREPLRAWIAKAPLARTGAELRSFTTSFVGRKEELARLQDLLDEATHGRSPRFALIVGEPGIGKSRLLAEYARRLDEQSTVVNWRQGRCLPFGLGVTFWPLSEIVKACAGILESDGVARAEARLETVLTQGDRDLMRARLRPLVGLEAEEASREDNFHVWRRFLEDLALNGPTVLVVEDLHWADEGMLAFMDYLATSDAKVPLLVLATSRPEILELPGPGSGYVTKATRVPLGPLSGDETAQLVLMRMNATSLPVGLQAKLLERSGGNPLFAEELVRLLEDRDLLEIRAGQTTLKEGAELPTPDSIGALIAARLDLLAPERKALLSDAAVVGRTFWAGAVAAVGGHELSDVYGGLHELVAKELVRPVRASSVEGETEFLFVHALVRDVAYGQLTRADRAVRHAAFARWLEQRTTGRTEDLAEILAYHYGIALEMAEACGLDKLEDELVEPTGRYLALAGGRAAPLDEAAAQQHFARARRVAEEAQRPKRRWLLSRRTRRTIRRRAPLLVGAAAVIVVAAVAALGIWAFMPSKTPNPASAGATGPKTLTMSQIADRYGQSVVHIATEVPVADGARIRWKPVSCSGVVVSEDGLIFTNGRPFMSKTMPSWQTTFVTVEHFGDQGQYRKVKGVFLGSDGGGVGVVKADAQGARLHPIPLGDSDAINKGDVVVTLSRDDTFLAWASGSIGDWLWHNPLEGQDAVAAMRTTAALPKSATGGALIDTGGRLIGVMGGFYYDRERAGYTGRDVAVAVNLFKFVVGTIQKADRSLPAAWLGIAGSTVTPQLATSLDISGGRGVLVEFVESSSPAEKGGIVGGSRVETVGGNQYAVGGDVIVGIEGSAVRSSEDLTRILGQIDPGTIVSVRILRRPPGPPGERWPPAEVTVKVTLVANPLRS